MTLLSDIGSTVASDVAGRVINQAFPANDPILFNTGWRKVVSYILGTGVALFFCTNVLVATVNAIHVLFTGSPISHYDLFQAAMGHMTLTEIINTSAAMVWGGLNVVHNSVLNKNVSNLQRIS